MENIFTTSQSEDYNNINTDNSITDSPNSSTSYIASEASIGYGDMKGGGEEQVKEQVEEQVEEEQVEEETVEEVFKVLQREFE